MVSRKPSRRLPAAGFTLIEVILVVIIFVLLIAIILPAINQARRSAWLAICASNEHTIYEAYHNFQNDNKMRHGSSAELVAAGWPVELYTHFGKENSITLCPEDDTDGGGGGFVGDFHAAKGSGFPSSINGWYDMQSGPLHRKLSLTQYENLQAAHGDGDGGWWPYFASGGGYDLDGGYKDDGRDVVFLVIEDIIGPGGVPAGDKDFNDVQIKIEYQADGGARVSAKKASGNRFWLTYGENRELMFADKGGGELGWGWYGPVEMEFGSASYGMNQHINDVTGGKVMLLDYVKTSASPDRDDWTWMRDAEGKLRFGRHINHRVNVLTRDGAVAQWDPELLNPSFTTVRTEHWLP